MDLYEILNKLDISYEQISREAVFTIEQAQFIKTEINGIGCKNLFLTNKKGGYYLIMLEESKKADIKQISASVGEKRLSFADADALKEILGLQPGGVTPLGIINDKSNSTILIIDGELTGKRLLVHPDVNTKTLTLDFDDLIKFIQFTQHKYIITRL